MIRFRIGAVAVVALAVTGLSLYARAVVQAAAAPVHLMLVAYSTPRDAFGELVKAFQSTPQGSGVMIDESYGGSGEQSRAVQNGLQADIVAFSLEPDIERLVGSGIVAGTWDHTPTHGMVTRSVVVFVTRKGNPKHIQGWNDLLLPGLEVITPNPFTSGGARWNIAAAYGAQLQSGQSKAQAATYLQNLFSHVVVQDKSAREALQTFVGGKGDVMIAYESEAILAQHKGMDVTYVVPRPTILIENPIAVTSTTLHAAEANAFVAFLLSPQGQQVFAKYGYRPVIASVNGAAPKKDTTFTISSLGGWQTVDRDLFDVNNGLVSKIEQNLGVAGAGR